MASPTGKLPGDSQPRSDSESEASSESDEPERASNSTDLATLNVIQQYRQQHPQDEPLRQRLQPQQRRSPAETPWTSPRQLQLQLQPYQRPRPPSSDGDEDDRRTTDRHPRPSFPHRRSDPSSSWRSPPQSPPQPQTQSPIFAWPHPQRPPDPSMYGARPPPQPQQVHPPPFGWPPQSPQPNGPMYAWPPQQQPQMNPMFGMPSPPMQHAGPFFGPHSPQPQQTPHFYSGPQDPYWGRPQFQPQQPNGQFWGMPPQGPGPMPGQGRRSGSVVSSAPYAGPPVQRKASSQVGMRRRPPKEAVKAIAKAPVGPPGTAPAPTLEGIAAIAGGVVVLFILLWFVLF